ncbi:MAG: ABC transporter permease [Armatimonadota bacterium]
MSDSVGTGGGGVIADLSYRGYDGPLRPHVFRWWPIARTEVRLAVRKRAFWVVTIFCAFPYLVVGAQLYFQSLVPGGLQMMLGQQSFASRFYNGYSGALFQIFLMALIVGAPTIAADNQANALQILLAKPITKLDYVVGKWVGVFSILASVSLVPALVLYLFCLGAFANQGFMPEAGSLLVRIIAAGILPAALHASVVVGVSARSRAPRIATAAYAGLYFVLAAVSQVGAVMVRSADPTSSATLGHLSVSGVLSGLGQHIFDAQPGLMGAPIMWRGHQVPRPELLPLAATAVALSVIGVVLARSHVRAVEVVRD